MICKYKPEMVITEGNEQNSIKEHLVNLFYTSWVSAQHRRRYLNLKLLEGGDRTEPDGVTWELWTELYLVRTKRTLCEQ